MAIIARYKFNSSLCADYLPTFNAEFTGYTKTDVDNGDGTITRTISHDTLKPTFMKFGVKGAVTDREKSLLEVIECDTSNITDMENMFRTCSNLVILDTSGFNTSKTKKMNAMFQYCSGLTNLDVSNFDTSQSTSMSYMFDNCSSLTSLNLSNFDTSNVNNMGGMFQSCSSLTSLNLSNFDTSNVNNMQAMFNSCSSLTSLDLSNFDTSNVNNMGGMFNKCPVSNIGLLYTTSTTINGLLTELGTSTARNIYYTDAPLDELTVQDNITYIKYELTKATFPYTLNKLPNGVADYIDVVNKVHVQRVGSAVLDGSEDWNYGNPDGGWANGNTSYGFYSYDSNGFDNKKQGGVSLTDKFITHTGSSIVTDESKIGFSLAHTDYVVVRLSQDTLSDNNPSTLQTYLASNPITVLYELATPIYTPLTEEEIAQLPLSAYADGSVNLSSDQLMPSFEFRMRASNRYQVDMLETGYYYLNAPIGNVKLGTANVDVQQMPCIIKVDDVGTGDSGYRLSTVDSFYKEVSLDYEEGYLNISNGTIAGIAKGRWASDYIEIPLILRDTYIYIGSCEGVDFVFYDENKTYIAGTTFGTIENNYKSCRVHARAKYIRLSGRNDRMKIDICSQPITLAKLPSHRIPSSFSQGMKCGTDFGCWEGDIGARPTMFRTSNIDDAWKIVESSVIEDGNGVVLNRIEISSMSLIIEDELDIATGKLTKRVGKVVFDGSSDESWSISIKETSLVKTKAFQVSLPTKSRENYICINNRIPYDVGWEKDFERLWIDNRSMLVVHTDKAFTVDSFRLYLASNPIIVYYPLEVPEISYPKISSTQVKTVAKTALQCLRWENGYLNAQVKPSHLTYPVPSLVGNRTYTVVHNRKNITGSTKPIELNLGGTVVQLNDASSKTLVKTPSTLAHSNLIFIGGESTVDHIMVLDGDWTNKPIEYFENMKGHDTDAIITIIGDGKIDDVAEQYLW